MSNNAAQQITLVTVSDEIQPAALRPEDAAKYLGRAGAVKTLANWRSLGRGPRFVRVLGAPVYPIAELDAYLAQGGDPKAGR